MPIEIIETNNGHYRYERNPYEPYEFFLERIRKGRKAIENYFGVRRV